MKLLSIVVPCYNSMAYMSKCIDSLLIGGDEVEIIIVNDGSTDETLTIANGYQEAFPQMVKVINQENKGHGGALNSGLKLASGQFFKVVDSDDWVDATSYEKILRVLRGFQKESPEMVISNFIYDKQGKKHKAVMNYRSVFPQDQLFTWDQMKPLRKGRYLLMHSVIYRTNVLKECELELPEHTFYVDNIFVYQPLPYVKKLYYIDIDFYHYFIGRDDQSVNEKVHTQRINQQILVNKLMIDIMSQANIKSEKLRQYMISYLDICTAISSILLLILGTEVDFEKKQELWDYLKSKDINLYRKIRYGLIGLVMNLPGKLGRKMTLFCYRVSQKIVGFS